MFIYLHSYKLKPLIFITDMKLQLKEHYSLCIVLSVPIMPVTLMTHQMLFPLLHPTGTGFIGLGQGGHNAVQTVPMQWP
jgi:hypothetical protein